MCRRFFLIFIVAFSAGLQAQVEIFRNERDTATYIPPGDTITKPPQFETGENDFFRYIESHFNVRLNSQSLDYNGAIVRFSFYIDKDGSVSEYELLFTTNAIVASEIGRVVTLMPNWNPGYQDGKKKRTLMVYDLGIQLINDVPPILVTKNNSSAEYTDKTKNIKWFLVAGSIMIMFTVWVVRYGR